MWTKRRKTEIRNATLPCVVGKWRIVVAALMLLQVVTVMPAQAQCAAENKAFTGGEKVEYDLYFNWSFIWNKVGLASLNTTETAYEGKPAYRLDLLSVGSKRTDFFFKMRDTLTCYVTQQLEPLYYRKAAEEGSRYTIDEAWYAYNDGVSYVKQQRTWPWKDRPVEHAEHNDSRCIFDMLSILTQARSYNPDDYRVGDRILFPMVDGRKVEEQTLIYRGRENIEANDKKTYRCLVFSFVEKDKKGKENEVITFFVSDDKNHLPIRLDMYLRIGSAKAFLKKATGTKYPLTDAVVKK